MERTMEFFEAPAFSRYLARYLDDEQYRAFQDALANAPELGDLMPGTGGFRKLRWADVRRGKGRRGGLRVIYYWFDGRNQIWLMTIYDKNEASDLTPEQKKLLRAAIGAEKQSRAGR
jgi:mRNA-degrading endonuclease RelE of RelBE toxin-antitoxin system